MCLPTPGLNIFLGAAVVVKWLPRYVKSVTRSMTSLPQVMPPMFSGYRFLISLILDAFTLSQTMVACFRSPSHVCDLLAQQNQIVGEVHVFQLLQQGELDPCLVVTKGLSGSLFMELMHGCWENLLCVWYLVVLHLDLRTLSVAASQILPTRVNNLTIYWRAVYDRLTSHPGGVLLLPFVHSFGNQSAVSWFISRRCRFSLFTVFNASCRHKLVTHLLADASAQWRRITCPMCNVCEGLRLPLSISFLHKFSVLIGRSQRCPLGLLSLESSLLHLVERRST